MGLKKFFRKVKRFLNKTKASRASALIVLTAVNPELGRRVSALRDDVRELELLGDALDRLDDTLEAAALAVTDEPVQIQFDKDQVRALAMIAAVYDDVRELFGIEAPGQEESPQ